jgi:hypothetical protein
MDLSEVGHQDGRWMETSKLAALDLRILLQELYVVFVSERTKYSNFFNLLHPVAT